MQEFCKNIIFVSNGLYGEEQALTQAVSLVQHTQAKLKILIYYPTMPKKLVSYKDFHQQSLRIAVDTMLKTASKNCNYPEAELAKNLSIDIQNSDNLIISAISEVVKNKYDLVIKSAEFSEGNKGLKALDMGILRKCPVPVWLSHSLKSQVTFKKIAVAIDPESYEKNGSILSQKLLQTAEFIANKYSAELDIISCWVYAYEDILRENLPTAPQVEVDSLVQELKDVHAAKLQQIIDASDIKIKYNLQHIKGTAENMIPKFIEQNNIDLLVMGTIERKWLDKFLMGNTAEDILRKITCSLLALKPEGFESPIS